MTTTLTQNDLPQELRFATKPTLDFKFFVIALVDNYEAGHRNLAYGWVLYDYLDKNGKLTIAPAVKKEFFAKAKQDVKLAKAMIIDLLFESGVITIEEIRELIKFKQTQDAERNV